MNPPVKVVRPRLPKIVERLRLLRDIDRARKRHRAIWIVAPPGAGKTTLVSHYLEQRHVSNIWYQVDEGDEPGSLFHYLNLAAQDAKAARHALPRFKSEYQNNLGFFSRRYFEALYRRLRPASVLVFDNYQEARADSRIHDIVCQAIDQLPAGMNVIVISRTEPPAALARLRASETLGFIGWEQLKLNSREFAAMVRLRGIRLTRAGVQQIETLTQGWAAGVVLALEGKSAGIDLNAPGAVPQVVFDYFAGEIFERAPQPTRDLLLQTAFVPAMTAARVNAVTGTPRAARVLEEFAKRNYFTSKTTQIPPVYQFHPLFREFLLNRATTTYGAAKIHEVRRRCAHVLAQTGELENAIALLQQAEDWPTAMAIMLKNARALIDQGRAQTLDAWLASLPEALRAESGWALYWFGVCRLPFAPLEARKHFMDAFARFERGKDASPLYLAWAGVVNSFLLEWSDFNPVREWVEKYSTLGVDRKPPSPDVEAETFFSYLSALSHGRPNDPSLPSCAERAEALLRRQTNEDRRFSQATPVIQYYLRCGDMIRVGSLLEYLASYAANPNARPLARLDWYTWKAIQATCIGATDECRRAVTEGLALAEASGIHVRDMLLIGYGVYGQLCAGDIAGARTAIEKMSRMPNRGIFGDSFYTCGTAFIALHERKFAAAVEEATRSAGFARASRAPAGMGIALACLASAHAYLGEWDLAMQTIAHVRSLSAEIGSKGPLYLAAFVEANMHRLRGAREESLRALREVLRLGQETGMGPQPMCLRDDVARLFATALEADLSPSYVRTMILRAELAPPADLLPEKWPWKLKVYTLGRFVIVKDDVDLALGGKTQKKPLQLLWALIALGGSVSAAKLAQTLWPDTDAGMAAHALETTVYRLRKLCGEHAVMLKNGQLELNLSHCWCDVPALQQLLDDATISPAARAERLLALYRGEFLGDVDKPWALIQRERLRSKFLGGIVAVGDAFEAQEDWPRAAQLYQNAIEIDPLAETIYCRLMSCHLRLGRSAEALDVYRRCRTTLASVLDMEPAPETQILLQRIQSTAS